MPDKILVIQTASIGDVILATPVIEKLHHFYPSAKIDFLLKKGNEGLFKEHPFLDEILVWDKKEGKYRNLISIIRKIRSKKYDYVINIQRFASSGVITALSGAKIKIGFNKNPFSFLFTKKVKHLINDIHIHETDRNLALIEDLTGKGHWPVKLYPTAQDHQKIHPYTSSPFITVAPASLWFTKQFPEEKWIEFLKKVDTKFMIYLLGSKNDYELCSRIMEKAASQQVQNLAGKLTFLQTSALMKAAVMNYVNDSAPQHLASAVNAAITVVFCSTVPEFGFGPLSDDSEVIQTDLNLACRPCGLHGFNRCPEEHFDCAYSISVDKLLRRL